MLWHPLVLRVTKTRFIFYFAINNLHFEPIFPTACSCIGISLFQYSIDTKISVSSKFIKVVLGVYYVYKQVTASVLSLIKHMFI